MTLGTVGNLDMRRWVWLVGGVIVVVAGDLPRADAQLPAGGYQVKRLGLTGPGYEYASGGLRHSSYVESVNNAGQAGGVTSRYSSTGASLGADAWLTTGATSQVLGLTGSVYQYTGANGVMRISDFEALNNAGQATGASVRLTGPGDQFGALGRDAWFYNGATTQQVGFTGGVYEYNAAGGVYRFSLAYFLDDAGRVAGLSNRYASDGTQTGGDAWMFNGTTTQNIGLTGAGYEWNDGSGIRRYSRVQGFNNAGQAAGVSNRVTPAGVGLGVAAWRYDGATTQAIGLTGPGYDVTFPSGTAHENQAILINDSGQVAGYATRYSAVPELLGYDAWLFDGTSSQVAGLTGSGYEYNASGGVFRLSIPAALSNAGHAAGVSARVTSAGDSLGNDAWFFDGTSAKSVGLTGSGYEYNANAGVYRFSEVHSTLAINDAGQVAGVSTRYGSGTEQGQAGWFYDDSTGVTTPLVFSVHTGDNYSFTEPQIVTEDGVVLGVYERFNGATSLGKRPFWWTLADGMRDLGDLVDGGLNAAGWQSLLAANWRPPDAANRTAGSLANAAPQYIVGTGLVTGQPSGSGQSSTYLLTAIPGNSLTADFNGDTKVDKDDLALWRGGFGTATGATHAQGDADGDHDVDGADFLTWQRQVTSNPAVVASASAPEPSTAMLLSIAFGVAVLHRRGASRRNSLKMP